MVLNYPMKIRSHSRGKMLENHENYFIWVTRKSKGWVVICIHEQDENVSRKKIKQWSGMSKEQKEAMSLNGGRVELKWSNAQGKLSIQSKVDLKICIGHNSRRLWWFQRVKSGCLQK